jgi:uncharacterized membrane protein
MGKPSKTLKKQKSALIAATAEIRRSGPLPDAEQMQGYENTLPGAADRIIAMAEQQAAHRQALENASLKAEVHLSILGLIFAFVLSLIVMIGGGLLVYHGSKIPGTMISLGAIASLCAVFIYGTRRKKQ